MTASRPLPSPWTPKPSLLLPIRQVLAHVFSTCIMIILTVYALVSTANDPIEVAPKEKKECVRRVSSSPRQTLNLLAEEMNVNAPHTPRIHGAKLDGLVDVFGIKAALGPKRIISHPLADPVTEQLRKPHNNAEYYALFHGYHCDTHRVITVDGFSLLLHRIRIKSHLSTTQKQTVLVQHGLFQSAGVFVTNGQKQSLAFYLADLGYDVWLGNNRCVEKKHATLSSSDVEFWDWSLDELARYDFPALVDYVRKTAQVEKIIYVGHSQGNAQAFLGCKLDPRIPEKISCFVALAPTAYIGPLLDSAPMKYLIEMNLSIYQPIFGVKQFLPIMDSVQEYLPASWFMRLAYSMFSYLFSWHDYNWDEIHKNHYFQFTPRPTSSKAILHWCRCARLRTLAPFSQVFDESYSNDSYNRCSPSYDFSCLGDMPVALFYGSRDSIIDGDRVMREARGKCNLVYGEHLDGYEHLDVIWALDAKQRVFDPMVMIFDKLREERGNVTINNNATTTTATVNTYQ
ncbi:hypothetical protein SeLEV6574_g03976 [Synchytrium endobioticum]|uniref:Partial AB-hydrolase lipase domain-containing protein n=1 Tax=Synchytrium endobioticum TaxID=286115 RepID=A0A507D1N1_9FUNG|nr:hypothetical protein SeLEV6574_g03976 [Synchytrium endobioticum]